MFVLRLPHWEGLKHKQQEYTTQDRTQHIVLLQSLVDLLLFSRSLPHPYPCIRSAVVIAEPISILGRGREVDAGVVKL